MVLNEKHGFVQKIINKIFSMLTSCMSPEISRGNGYLPFQFII